MSDKSKANEEALRQVSEALANQPKQDGAEKEASKDERAEAEQKLRSTRKPGATTSDPS